MSSGTVTVAGHAVVTGQPDEARVAIQLTELRSSADTALDEVGRRSEELERVLADLEVPLTARTTSGVGVQEEQEYDGTARRYLHRGYRATNRIEIRLDDEKKIGRLIKEATARAKAEIQGPWWQIALSNPARVEAFKQAAGDAKRKAEAYAQALGARIGTVVRVSEPSAGWSHRYEGTPSVMSADPEPAVEVRAGELDVAASVEVTFALEQS